MENDAIRSTYFSVSSYEFSRKWLDEVERWTKTKLANQSYGQPMIFIDEMNWLNTSNSDDEVDSECCVKTEILMQIHCTGCDTGGVLVLGATNISWTLLSAIRAQFRTRYFIPSISQDTRFTVFKIYLNNLSFTIINQNLRLK